jgi:CheY-like chemotaxis protein
MSEGEKVAPRGTVLVVDDNSELRSLLRMWLGRHGCRVVEAADGRAAVEAVRRDCPDLVLMDLHLPKMDGFAAARRIRELCELSPRVPILAVSADNELGVEARRVSGEERDAGFADFVPKPFSPRQLGDLLDHYLPEKGDESGA